MNKYGKADSLLNMNEIKEAYILYYTKALMASRQNTKDVTALVEEQKPFIIGYVNNLCNLDHLICEQFGNTLFHKFIGIPLKESKIPASYVLTYEMQKILPNMKKLQQTVNSYTSENNPLGKPHIAVDVKGGDNDNGFEGDYIYVNGNIRSGCVLIKTAFGNDDIIYLYTIEEVKPVTDAK